MLVLGIVLLVIGLIFSIGILQTLGIILIVVGALMYLLGAIGRPIGPVPTTGRRYATIAFLRFG